MIVFVNLLDIATIGIFTIKLGKLMRYYGERFGYWLVKRGD